MNQPLPESGIVLKTAQRRECMESRLVLDAAGISSEIRFQDGWCLLIVRGDDLAAANEELEDYRQEKLEESTRRSERTPIYDGAAKAVFVYAGVIIFIGVLSAPWGFAFDLSSVGQMQAGRVTAGEWWRTVTALTLHVDVAHIASNLVFGAVFGLLAGQALGGGVAWLAIVIAGALGNLINAWVQAPNHTSIGASTAVFAALGLIVSHSLRSWKADRDRPLRRWSPLIGGILLFAYTGVGGERTDVLAHVTGFSAGLLIGWIGCRLPHEWLSSQKVQKWAGCIAIALVTTAWVVAIVNAD